MRPFSPSAQHARLLGLLLLSLIPLLGSGCARWGGPKPPRLPEAFATLPQAALLANPDTRAQGYAQLFPELPKVQLSGRLIASGSWWQGKEHFSCLYFRWRPLVESDPQLRLNGFLQQGMPLFDVIVQQGIMTVLLHPEATIFTGPVPTEGTAFARRFGVEPWQLSRPLVIGQELAGAGRTSGTLPTTDTLRLRWVEYDPASGMPSRAGYGDAQVDRWTVRYLAWNMFTDDQAGPEPRLLPERIEIERDDPRIKLQINVESYRFSSEVPAKIFTPYVDRPYRTRPLTDLNQVIEAE